jgi:hypothetical protein
MGNSEIDSRRQLNDGHFVAFEREVALPFSVGVEFAGRGFQRRADDKTRFDFDGIAGKRDLKAAENARLIGWDRSLCRKRGVVRLLFVKTNELTRCRKKWRKTEQIHARGHLHRPKELCVEVRKSDVDRKICPELKREGKSRAFADFSDFQIDDELCCGIGQAQGDGE